MPTISYLLTTCNEHVELEKLLDQINSFIRDEDEIILQLDSNHTLEVYKVALKYKLGTKYGYHIIMFPLNNDFASFKNNALLHCRKDVIVALDADELLSEDLIRDLIPLLESNPTTELFFVPRENRVEGLTKEWIKKWGWNVDNKGRINMPDFQSRIFLKSPNIKWVNQVHERIVGNTTYAYLPEQYHIVHNKTIEKQIKQNELYSKI